MFVFELVAFIFPCAFAINAQRFNFCKATDTPPSGFTNFMQWKALGVIQSCGLIFRIYIPEVSGAHRQNQAPIVLGSAYTKDGLCSKTL